MLDHLVIIVVLSVIAVLVLSSEEHFDFIMNPQLQRGDRFYLRDQNNEYVSICSGCQPIDQNLENQCSSVLCMKRYPLRGSVWIYKPHDDGTFSIQSEATGLYWKRCSNCVENCPNIICGDGVNGTLQPARFELVKVDSATNTIAIKTDIGTFIDLNQCDQKCGVVLSGVGALNQTLRVEVLPPLVHPMSRIGIQEPRVPVRQSYAPIVIPYQSGSG